MSTSSLIFLGEMLVAVNRCLRLFSCKLYRLKSDVFMVNKDFANKIKFQRFVYTCMNSNKLQNVKY